MVVISVICGLSALLAIVLVVLQKAYNHVPLHELKRRAQTHDKTATLLYKTVSFGMSARIVLWGLMGLANAVVVWILAKQFIPPVAVVLITVWIWFVFVWFPASRFVGLGLILARYASPLLIWLLNYIHPLLDRVTGIVQRFSQTIPHTNMYEKTDLVAVLDRQMKQTDNRMASHELAMASHALSFGDKLVRDYMTPRSQVVSVDINEEVGPILMDRLHKSGHSRFPVFQDKKDNVVGTLYMHDLARMVRKGVVSDIAKPDIFYAHEEQTLYQTLQAFLKTKHHLFVVVNSFEELVGVISLEDVLEQIVGQPIVDEFDQYEDLRAVAAREAKQVHKEQNHEKPAADNKDVVQ